MSSAALWGIRHSSSVYVHVTVPTAAGRQRRRCIVVHRSVTLGPADVDEEQAIAVTSVSRTLLDLAGMLSPGRLERAVERSLALRLFDLRAVEAVLDANPRRRGVGTLARIVRDVHYEPQLTRSELEALMRDLCDAPRHRTLGSQRQRHRRGEGGRLLLAGATPRRRDRWPPRSRYADRLRARPSA